MDAPARLTSPTAGRGLKRRDSIGDRIERSIAEHIMEETADAADVAREEALDDEEKLSISTKLQATGALKADVNEKLQLARAPSHPIVHVLLIIASLYNHDCISMEARSVLKDQAIDEVRRSNGILSAAVELLCQDGDVDECVDTFVQVGHMLLAKAL
ncbi:hypothetical protein, variant 2 [Aphanomyces invadans]|uniref:Uncharacterized protein n=1 Tax=Aphanomyces invadans TaxID=157072 RepID=A0A024UMQ3_9STRA|nr:hypothetical protein H310_01943 [Aphanomyces invadans]XP_008863514.1 hypothetical protein, variant 1 [Aphanomyces invadans]XP_008863515.1 hypothetical protein, variant 2 [Aphanomyces invadans]ETW07420.1 hypothetical protein H310_01943 [Aphanomyces invadans]ETW07421.1 hypothetical protein, variant 1 [Aphanomyces invadans]ETW07422.1 hypothetical protein, variant 2 [Aphanomyces invadans]|eukprot:XP_008863513.1 hypothetical protein H310_01943 [Aphanomyces invadans]